MSPSPFASASTISFPLCSVFFLISIPWFAKNPFWMPRSSGKPFAIGSVSRLIVVSLVLPGALAAEPPNNSTDTSADRIAVAKNRRLIPVLPPDRFSCGYRQLPLDQPVDVPAQVHELGQLFRRDLISRPIEVDLHDLLHFRWRVREYDYAIGEVYRLVDVVSDKQDRDAVLLANAQHEVFKVAARLGVD